jgi:hypothetical protein
MSAIIAPGARPPPAHRQDHARELLAGTLIALVRSCLVVYYLPSRRGSALISWDYFTTVPTGRFLGSPAGVQVGDRRH